MDEELAEAAEELGEDRQSGAPTLPVSEMTPEVQMLMMLVKLNEALLQQGSKKRITFPPTPVLKTARSIVRERRRLKHRNRMESRIAEAQALWDELHATPAATAPVVGADASWIGDDATPPAG